MTKKCILLEGRKKMIPPSDIKFEKKIFRKLCPGIEKIKKGGACARGYIHATLSCSHDLPFPDSPPSPPNFLPSIYLSTDIT